MKTTYREILEDEIGELEIHSTGWYFVFYPEILN